MDAAEVPGSARHALKGLVVFAALVGGPLALSLSYAQTPVAVAPGASKLLPQGDGIRNPRIPEWSTDPSDPFPMPAELAGVELMKQTEQEARAKSAGCITCHQNVGDPHGKPTLRLGCTDCHGGNAGCVTTDAHVRPRQPHLWPTSANPVRSYALL